MKVISWNVNGLRACAGKGFEDIFKNLDALCSGDLSRILTIEKEKDDEKKSIVYRRNRNDQHSSRETAGQ